MCKTLLQEFRLQDIVHVVQLFSLVANIINISKKSASCLPRVSSESLKIWLWFIGKEKSQDTKSSECLQSPLSCGQRVSSPELSWTCVTRLRPKEDGEEEEEERRRRGGKGKKDNRVVHSVVCEREEDWVPSEHYEYKRSQSSNYSHLHWPETRILLDAQ